MDVGPEFDIETYAESIGRELDVEEEEGFLEAEPEVDTIRDG